MRIFVLFMILFCAMPNVSWASDPDGIREMCQKHFNKTIQNTDCDCIVSKYYPQKAELSKQYGVPIQGEMVLMHISQNCLKTEASADREFKLCQSHPTFKEDRKLFGSENFCKCYADTWQKSIDNHIASDRVLDPKSARHLKGNARMDCQRKLK